MMEKKKISYIKPHGSVDWFKLIEGGPNDLDILRGGTLPLGFEQKLQNAEIALEQHTSDHMTRNGKTVFKYPAITAPIGQYEPICLKHIEEIKPVLQKTEAILSIGFSALDNDILDLLNENILSVKKLIIVNGDGEEGVRAYRKIASTLKNKLKVTLKDAVFPGGFTHFIGEGNLRSKIEVPVP